MVPYVCPRAETSSIELNFKHLQRILGSSLPCGLLEVFRGSDAFQAVTTNQNSNCHFAYHDTPAFATEGF
jgi:hypothetical protein